MKTTGLLCALLMSVTVCRSADWSEFRGPDGQGHADVAGLPVEWSTTKNVLWKTPIEGLGWSSPIVIKNRVYLTTAVPGAGEVRSLRTLCLDADSGKVVWDREVFKQSGGKVHSKNSHASSTPISDGEKLFVHFGTHGTACLTLDGKVEWTNSELKYSPVHGNGGSPVLVDEFLVVSCDGGDREFIVALDRKTGKIRWQTDRTATHLAKKFAFGTPLVITLNGEQQIVSQGAGAVYGYRVKDGSLIWKVDYEDGYSVIPRPVFAHGLLFIATGYDRPKLLAIDPTGTGDITKTHVKWTLTRGAPHTPSPLVVGDELYVVSDNGIATCLDAKTGNQHWQERLGGGFSASPLAADGRVYFQKEDGETIVVKASKEFSEIAHNKLEPRTFASFAVYGQSFLIRTEENLYRIGAKN